MLTPREKSTLPKAQGRIEPAIPHHAGQWAQHTIDWAVPAHLLPSSRHGGGSLGVRGDQNDNPTTTVIHDGDFHLTAIRAGLTAVSRGRYHGGRRPSSDDSPTVIPPSALDKPSIMKRYHRRRTCRHTSPRFMILGLSNADGGTTVGLWRLSSLDGRRPPWYRPQVRL